MFKKIGVQFLALAMVVLMTGTDLTAQTRIRFARGRNSASASGTLGAGGYRRYVLRASAGQQITATLSSTNGKVDFSPGNVHDTQYSISTDRNGDYSIGIDNHGGRATKFTLTISIQ